MTDDLTAECLERLWPEVYGDSWSHCDMEPDRLGDYVRFEAAKAVIDALRDELEARTARATAAAQDRDALIAATVESTIAALHGPLWRAILSTEDCLNRVCDDTSEAGGCLCGPKIERIEAHARARALAIQPPTDALRAVLRAAERTGMLRAAEVDLPASWRDEPMPKGLPQQKLFIQGVTCLRNAILEAVEKETPT